MFPVLCLLSHVLPTTANFVLTVRTFFREGVQAALIDLFFGPRRLHDPTIDGDELLAHALADYPNAQVLFYGSKSNL